MFLFLLHAMLSAVLYRYIERWKIREITEFRTARYDLTVYIFFLFGLDLLLGRNVQAA